MAFLVLPAISFGANKKSQTTIILINSKAVLVELGAKGEVLKEYINVPDYFTSYRSHESLVERSIRKIKGLSRVHKSFDPNHFLSVVSDLMKDNDQQDEGTITEFISNLEDRYISNKKDLETMDSNSGLSRHTQYQGAVQTAFLVGIETLFHFNNTSYHRQSATLRRERVG